jgi:hypothetical protein
MLVGVVAVPDIAPVTTLNCRPFGGGAEISYVSATLMQSIGSPVQNAPFVVTYPESTANLQLRTISIVEVASDIPLTLLVAEGHVHTFVTVNRYGLIGVSPVAMHSVTEKAGTTLHTVATVGVHVVPWH